MSDGRVEAAVAGNDHVFHCAAVADVHADPALTWSVNHAGTRRVVDACQQAGVRRLVHVGSASSFAFGPRHAPGDESGAFPAAYRNVPYMESKHRAMEEVLDAEARGELDTVVVAPTFMLGVWDSRPSSGELVRQFLRRRPPCVPRGGRNFVFAGDVARALVAARDRGRSGACYLAGGENLGYREFFGKVARAAGLRPPRFHLPRVALLAAGIAGSLATRLTGRPSPLDLRTARLACLEACYSSARARDELGLVPTSVDFAIGEALTGLRRFGHLD